MHSRCLKDDRNYLMVTDSHSGNCLKHCILSLTKVNPVVIKYTSVKQLRCRCIYLYAIVIFNIIHVSMIEIVIIKNKSIVNLQLKHHSGYLFHMYSLNAY